MLYGTRVVLRRMTDEDLTYLAGFNQEPEIIALTGGKYRRDESWPELQQVERRQRKRWTIMTRDEEIIGEIELDHILWRRREGELGVCIAKRDYWNQGLGQEAIKLLLNHAFSEMGLTSVYLRVFSENRRAVRAYERCSFRKIGIIQLPTGDGVAKHVLLMSVKSSEFSSSVEGDPPKEA